MRAFLLAAAAVLAGCVAPVEPASEPSATPSTATEATPVPTVLDWKGHIAKSELGMFMHGRPAEDVFWAVQQEGFILDVAEAPEVFEVALEWTNLPDGAESMIMLHSHKAEGTNAYVEHITEFDATAPKCLRVPAADIVAGHWQVMIHQSGADGADYTLKVLTVGGKVLADEAERHGHWFQDGAFEVEEHPIEPCSLYAPLPEE